MKPQRTHFNWSIERGDKCPRCRGLTVLVIAPRDWQVHDESAECYAKKSRKEAPEFAGVDEEITGHFCPKCERLVSLCLNS